MSYQDGWAALNLNMPKRVPRTEYAAETHWELVSEVTGIPVSASSDRATRDLARAAFCKAWNYDFFWSILTYVQIFDDIRTTMGHSNYASGNVDFNNQINCPFKSPEEVLAFDPWQVYGKRDKAVITREFEEHYKENCRRDPGGVNMTGIYVTCISGLIEIFGWDMLLTAAGIDPKAFGELANRYCSWIMQYFEALAAADIPIVMIHDDIVWTSGPFIAPSWYRQYVFPNYKKMFAPIVDSDKKLVYTSDGDYTIFVDDIVATGVHGFVLEPTTDMAYIAEKYGKTHAIIGNADTRILLDGTKEQIRNEVQRCMDIGKKCPGFFMAVGNHIPANTPVENAIYYNNVYEELCKR